MSVNVNRSVSDQFYRYKMPRLIAKVPTCEYFQSFHSSGGKTAFTVLKLQNSVQGLFRFWLFIFFPLIQVEGKGNGIKTVIVNMVDVAKALNRPPTCK